jgi:IS30 family transposase
MMRAGTGYRERVRADLGLGSSAICTLVERMTRFTLLLHLPRMTDHGHEACGKNGPAIAGHCAEAVCDAITRSIITLPEQLRRSLTWDQGAEMAQHVRLKIDAGIEVYFCDPTSPWQRGTRSKADTHRSASLVEREVSVVGTTGQIYG